MADELEQTRPTAVKEPLDLIMLSLDERIYVKIRKEREVKGTLNNYDQHLNMILGNVEETIMTGEIDEEVFKVEYRRTKPYIPMQFVHGGGVNFISPPIKSIVYQKFISKLIKQLILLSYCQNQIGLVSTNAINLSIS